MPINDEDILTKLMPSKALDGVAKRRLEKSKNLFLPGIPAESAIKASSATRHGLLVLQLIGLQVKLVKASTVKLSPQMLRAFRVSSDQLDRAVKSLVSTKQISVKSNPGKRREITLEDKTYIKWLGL